MRDEILIAPWDSQWAAAFEKEKALLLGALGPRFIGIEHIGSTAVSGLAAKPIIDLLGGVDSMTAADALLQPLLELGWETSPAFNAALTDRRFLLRWPEGVRTHHLHLVVHESEVWRQHLAFRDALRRDAQMAAEYARLKHDLAAQNPEDREAYTAAKSDFISHALIAKVR